MNKSRKTIIALFSILILVLIVTVVSFIFITINGIDKKGNAELYTLGYDKIPSITSVVGKRTINRISVNKNKSVITKKYQYINIKNSKSDVNHYISELKNNNFVNTTNIDLSKENGSVSLASLSVDDEYIIIINIKYDSNSYTIELKKGIGSITQFD